MSNVLLYTGPGVSPSALAHTSRTLKLLLPTYDVQTVSAPSLALDPWTESTALVVLPGGRDLPYLAELGVAHPPAHSQHHPRQSQQQPEHLAQTANERLRSYVSSGGSFLGICAGAYYASGRVEFELGTALQVSGSRPLRFFPGTCKGTVYPGFVYESDEGARVVRLEVDVQHRFGGTLPKMVRTQYNGGGAFLDAERYEGVRVLARYTLDDGSRREQEDEQDQGQGDGDGNGNGNGHGNGHSAARSYYAYAGQAAVIQCRIGRGTAILFGVHPEMSLAPSSRAVRLSGAPQVLPDEGQLEREEESRLELLRGTLRLLGLDVRAGKTSRPDPAPAVAKPDERSGASSKLEPQTSEQGKEQEQEQDPDQGPPNLTPLFLVSDQPGNVDDILSALRSIAVTETETGTGTGKGGAEDEDGTGTGLSSALAQLSLRAQTPTRTQRETTAQTQTQIESQANIAKAHILSVRDGNDTMHFYKPAADSETAHALVTICREADYIAIAASAAAAAAATAGAGAEAAPGPETGTTLSQPEPELDLHGLPKHVLCYGSPSTASAFPDARALTPYFDIEAYLAYLGDARAVQNASGSGSGSGGGESRWWMSASDKEKERVKLGQTVLYGEVVTSTQTMLDKNYSLLTRLPTGLIALATRQISGRGRGSNAWISPLGCLQFSLLLRLPASLAPRIVFIQYLAGLAIVEAVRTGLGEGYERLNVRIKWPNDVYAEVPEKEGDGADGAGGADAGTGAGGRKGTFILGGKRYAKMAGVLVNSQFAGKEFTLVVGCGVNTTNARPTTSLSDLIHAHNALLPEGAEPLAPVSQERFAGAIVATLENMWNTFVHAQGFEPFVERYRRAWLHSDQLATLSDTVPPTPVRIVGITSDYGMLRAVPCSSHLTTDSPGAWGLSEPASASAGGGKAGAGGVGGGRKGEWIDLQPDGNSFDMLQNLIRRK